MAKVARKLKRTGQTAEEVFQRLIEAILNGHFPSGSVLREARLAHQWDISRTPLREAMRRAAECGFIVLRPNRAPIIRRLTADDIHDLYDLREALERHALELAWPQFAAQDIAEVRKLALEAHPGATRDWPKRCLKFDLALHGLWNRRCGNSWLQDDLDWHYQFLRIFQRWIGRNHTALTTAYAEHLAILEAIERQDQPQAADLLRRHIIESAKLAQDAIPEPAQATAGA